MGAPAVGGYLQQWFDWRASFVLVSVAGMLALGGAWRLLHETHFDLRPMPGIGGMLRDYARLLRLPCFCGYAFSAAFSSAVFFAFLAGAPYLMVEVLDRPPSEYGLYFIMVAAGYMLGNFAAARLSRRVGSDAVIFAGSALAIAGSGLLLVLALAGVATPLALFAPMILITFSNGLNLPNALVGAMSVDLRMAGTASGLAGFLQMAAGAVATIVVGNLQDDSALPMILVMAVCAVAGLGAFALAILARRRQLAVAV